MTHDDLIASGYRQCAVGQRTTQWCAGAEKARERDEALLKQCLVALEHSTGLTLADCVRIRNAAIALRERLGEKE